MNKKGMEMWIIIAFILAVLILLGTATFIAKGGTYFKSNSGCASQGGKCVEKQSDCETQISFATCPEKQVCCGG